jgi:predicted enzyme related to lactoylglutathione lyase
MSAVGTSVGTFVWHEQVSNDPQRAQDFYKQLFGWEIDVWKPGEVDYGMISSGGSMHGGFGTAQEGVPPHWFGHVRVDSADTTADKAKAAGGKVLYGPEDIPDIGRFAVIADPKGAVFSAFQPAGDSPPARGVFVWDELVTEDVEGAKSFYGEVLGWTAKDMGEDFGGYRIFSSGDTQVAGLMQKPEQVPVPAAWQVYIGTDDVDASAEQAKELGATILQEPMDIPTIGRFAIVQDPLGAIFALFKGNE